MTLEPPERLAVLRKRVTLDTACTRREQKSVEGSYSLDLSRRRLPRPAAPLRDPALIVPEKQATGREVW
jgi:hypothetical protein